MPFNHLPKPVRVGVVGSTVVKKNGSAKIMVPDDRPRAHHPADVRKPEESVVGLVIKGQVDLFTHLREATSVCMNRALWPSGSSRCVQNERQGLRIECFGLKLCGLTFHKLVPPKIALRTPGDL